METGGGQLKDISIRIGSQRSDEIRETATPVEWSDSHLHFNLRRRLYKSSVARTPM